MYIYLIEGTRDQPRSIRELYPNPSEEATLVETSHDYSRDVIEKLTHVVDIHVLHQKNTFGLVRDLRANCYIGHFSIIPEASNPYEQIIRFYSKWSNMVMGIFQKEQL